MSFALGTPERPPCAQRLHRAVVHQLREVERLARCEFPSATVERGHLARGHAAVALGVVAGGCAVEALVQYRTRYIEPENPSHILLHGRVAALRAAAVDLRGQASASLLPSEALAVCPLLGAARGWGEAEGLAGGVRKDAEGREVRLNRLVLFEGLGEVFTVKGVRKELKRRSLERGPHLR